MATYRAEGVVLKRMNFGEADRIITVYTKHHGKITAIAKGVRKINSRRNGSLELFNNVLLFLHEGRNLDVVTEVQVFRSFGNIRRSLRGVAKAFFLAELVDKLTPHGQTNRAVFDLLATSLGNLDDGGEVCDFEMNLLSLLGFWSDGLSNHVPFSRMAEEIAERRIVSRGLLARV